ncbi:glucuronokinase with putative uridyl pyrophosphorylase isoform X2 [Amia ocellicauda]|uniref:glucuronokinase with putative uridyl pyrophosphorylase isoform X2 n=1 Tax=Amia ocellicauda TaxID=2972642 RepID=UPI003463E25B
MICILLVAGHGALLESQIQICGSLRSHWWSCAHRTELRTSALHEPQCRICFSTERNQNDGTGLYSHLTGVPKALLPGVGGKKILDFWWETVNTRQLFSEVYLVTNADKYKHYERWATANDFPVENVVNDGSTTLEGRLGAVADLELAIRSRRLRDDIMVIAGDMLCADQNFDIAQVLRFFRSKPGDLAIYYEMEEGESSTSRGIVEVCPESHRIMHFLEKPAAGVTGSRLASVVFYCLRSQTLPCLARFLALRPRVEDRTLGRLWEWLVNEEKLPVYGMKLPTGFQLIGQVGLSDYTKWLAHYSTKQQESLGKPIRSRSYARVGLMGNPSDGFHGKTIALSIANFWAEVSLTESSTLVLLPHPLNDPTEFGSLQDLFCISRKEGYLGGLRLLQATCKKFYQFCSKQGIALSKQNFTLKYDTNIPRQVGLAGSSAIVSATLKCLMKFFNITDSDLPKPVRANFILNVESEELFITAGLQDRVVQVYEGLVYMDFSKALMDDKGYGEYIPMDMSCLPPLWLAYLGDPSDSGRIHSDVRQRWLNGDPDVVEAMKSFAELTDGARDALQSRDWARLAELMDRNFDLRRSVYGDECLGQGNLKMVQLAKQVELKQAFQQAGCVFCHIVPFDPCGGRAQGPD